MHTVLRQGIGVIPGDGTQVKAAIGPKFQRRRLCTSWVTSAGSPAAMRLARSAASSHCE